MQVAASLVRAYARRQLESPTCVLLSQVQHPPAVADAHAQLNGSPATHQAVLEHVVGGRGGGGACPGVAGTPDAASSTGGGGAPPAAATRPPSSPHQPRSPRLQQHGQGPRSHPLHFPMPPVRPDSWLPTPGSWLVAPGLAARIAPLLESAADVWAATSCPLPNALQLSVCCLQEVENRRGSHSSPRDAAQQLALLTQQQQQLQQLQQQQQQQQHPQIGSPSHRPQQGALLQRPPLLSANASNGSGSGDRHRRPSRHAQAVDLVASGASDSEERRRSEDSGEDDSLQLLDSGVAFSPPQVAEGIRSVRASPLPRRVDAAAGKVRSSSADATPLEGAAPGTSGLRLGTAAAAPLPPAGLDSQLGGEASFGSAVAGSAAGPEREADRKEEEDEARGLHGLQIQASAPPHGDRSSLNGSAAVAGPGGSGPSGGGGGVCGVCGSGSPMRGPAVLSGLLHLARQQSQQPQPNGGLPAGALPPVSQPGSPCAPRPSLPPRSPSPQVCSASGQLRAAPTPDPSTAAPSAPDAAPGVAAPRSPTPGPHAEPAADAAAAAAAMAASAIAIPCRDPAGGGPAAGMLLPVRASPSPRASPVGAGTAGSLLASFARSSQDSTGGCWGGASVPCGQSPGTSSPFVPGARGSSAPHTASQALHAAVGVPWSPPASTLPADIATSPAAHASSAGAVGGGVLGGAGAGVCSGCGAGSGGGGGGLLGSGSGFVTGVAGGGAASDGGGAAAADAAPAAAGLSEEQRQHLDAVLPAWLRNMDVSGTAAPVSGGAGTVAATTAAVTAAPAPAPAQPSAAAAAPASRAEDAGGGVRGSEDASGSVAALGKANGTATESSAATAVCNGAAAAAPVFSKRSDATGASGAAPPLPSGTPAAAADLGAAPSALSGPPPVLLDAPTAAAAAVAAANALSRFGDHCSDEVLAAAVASAILDRQMDGVTEPPVPPAQQQQQQAPAGGGSHDGHHRQHHHRQHRSHHSGTHAAGRLQAAGEGTDTSTPSGNGVQSSGPATATAPSFSGGEWESNSLSKAVPAAMEASPPSAAAAGALASTSAVAAASASPVSSRRPSGAVTSAMLSQQAQHPTALEPGQAPTAVPAGAPAAVASASALTSAVPSMRVSMSGEAGGGTEQPLTSVPTSRQPSVASPKPLGTRPVADGTAGASAFAGWWQGRGSAASLHFVGCNACNIGVCIVRACLQLCCASPAGAWGTEENRRLPYFIPRLPLP